MADTSKTPRSLILTARNKQETVCAFQSNFHNQIPDLRVQSSLKLCSFSPVRHFVVLWNLPVCHRRHRGSPLCPFVLNAVYILHTFPFRSTLILFSHTHLILFSVLFSSHFTVKLFLHFSLPPVWPEYFTSNLITFITSRAEKLCKVLSDIYFLLIVFTSLQNIDISLLSKSISLLDLQWETKFHIHEIPEIKSALVFLILFFFLIFRFGVGI